MTAYVIVDYYEMQDRNLYEEYSRVGSPTVACYSGRGLAGSDQVETLEGDWHPRRLVLIEFDTVSQAKAWFKSAEYHQAAEIRRKAARCNIILVEGK